MGSQYMDNYENTAGLIFNIVHGSFVDGPGIRTTIFLKGCPLSCVWCCNPEGQSFDPQLRVISTRCNGCGRCIGACAKGALKLINGVVKVDRRRCDGCGKCTEVCWFDALDIWGKRYTVEEIFEIVLKDKSFYESSGGGLTIGGGEATCYPEFCLGLIRRCHDSNINVAIDTCGYVSSVPGLEVLKQADYILFDIKGLDDENHRRNTGVSNRLILNNLQMLNSLGKRIIIRIPVIPGYNDQDSEIENIAKLLSGLKSVERVDLISFHEFGEVKYQQLDRDYPVSTEAMSEQDQQEIKALFEGYGLKTQLGG